MPLGFVERAMSPANLGLGPIGRLNCGRPIDLALSLDQQKRQLVSSQTDIGQEMVVEPIQRGDGGLPPPFLEKLFKGLPQKDQHD
jgi:hypothetical protein